MAEIVRNERKLGDDSGGFHCLACQMRRKRLPLNTQSRLVSLPVSACVRRHFRDPISNSFPILLRAGHEKACLPDCRYRNRRKEKAQRDLLAPARRATGRPVFAAMNPFEFLIRSRPVLATDSARASAPATGSIAMKRNHDRVRAKILEIADAYRRRGYDVLVEPATGELPSFLADFHPDMIARGPEDSVVVEVKVGTRTTVSEGYRELAETIRQQAGWRFSLVVVDPRSDDVAPSAEQLLTSRTNRPAPGNDGRPPSARRTRGGFRPLMGLHRSTAEAYGVSGGPSPGTPPIVRLAEKSPFRWAFCHVKAWRRRRGHFPFAISLVHGFDVAGLGEVLGELGALTRRLLTEYDQAGK